MLFCLDGFHVYKHTSVDDGLLADLSNLAYHHLDSLDGTFIGISNGGWIHCIIYNGGYVDIF